MHTVEKVSQLVAKSCKVSARLSTFGFRCSWISLFLESWGPNTYFSWFSEPTGAQETQTPSFMWQKRMLLESLCRTACQSANLPPNDQKQPFCRTTDRRFAPRRPFCETVLWNFAPKRPLDNPKPVLLNCNLHHERRFLELPGFVELPVRNLHPKRPFSGTVTAGSSTSFFSFSFTTFSNTVQDFLGGS